MGKVFRYVWAAPATAVGILLAIVGSAFGARVRARRGVLEVCGGALARLVARTSPFVAITFGHVVLGVSREVLDRVRSHERAHVRQYERWGVLFFPLYLVFALHEWSRRNHPYHDNRFERQARAASELDQNELRKVNDLPKK